jgi:hypothetical protein
MGMDDRDNVAAMDDVTFLAERAKVRRLLERTPEAEVPVELAERYEALNEEFIRRARIAWQRVS